MNEPSPNIVITMPVWLKSWRRSRCLSQHRYYDTIPNLRRIFIAIIWRRLIWSLPNFVHFTIKQPSWYVQNIDAIGSICDQIATNMKFDLISRVGWAPCVCGWPPRCCQSCSWVNVCVLAVNMQPQHHGYYNSAKSHRNYIEGKCKQGGCCHRNTTSHHPNQCWDIVDLALRNKLQWNFNRNPNISIKKICLKMSSAKCCPFCLVLNALRDDIQNIVTFPLCVYDIEVRHRDIT